MSDTIRRCGDCKYERGGTCHRFPPIIHVSDSIWPVIRASDWCGEFAIRPYAAEPTFPKFAGTTRQGAWQQSFMEVGE